MSTDAQGLGAAQIERRMITLLEECARARWAGQRSQKDSMSACRAFIKCCIELGISSAMGIEQDMINVYAEGMAAAGLSASTRNTRLVAVKGFIDHCRLEAMRLGYTHANKYADFNYPYATRKKVSKWHMRDEHYASAMLALPNIAANAEEAQLVKDYIDWTHEVGLRVEESLRLLPEDFEYIGSERPALIVPGTKNDHSRVRIPISNKAALIIARRQQQVTPRSRRIFDISYMRLYAIWNALRRVMGVENDRTSTLKSLRRSFAAGALRKGLSARIIQELMRHSSLETTMEYLRLIGMSDNDETRALLNRQLGERKEETISHAQQMAQAMAASGHSAASLETATDVIKTLEAMGFKVVVLGDGDGD